MSGDRSAMILRLMAEAGVASAPAPAEWKKKVLVTGSGGMLGRDLVPVLAGAGCQVFARPRAELDITQADDVAIAFRQVRPEVVVNAAAYTKVDDCETSPRSRQVNAEGVRVLAEACRKQGAQLVHVSTDFVFG